MFSQIIAMAPTPGANAQAGQTSQGFTIGWMIFMVAIFYFVMIRPQRRREKERRSLIEAVKAGDRVLLANGIIGEVLSVTDKTLVMRTAKETKIEVLKSAMAQVLDGKDDLPSEAKV